MTVKMIDAARLGDTLPFCGLPPRELLKVVAVAKVNRLIAGAVLFDEGQPVGHFHMLLAGNIRFVRRTAEGDRIIVLHVPAGQMFGIGTALGQTTHRVTALAASACVVLSWPNALWPVFSGAYDGSAADTLRTFGIRADEMSTRIVELFTKLVEQRVACALLRMIAQSGRKVPGGIEIGVPITRQNIADMTGTTLHTVSRLLSTWERQGLIRSSRCLVVVTNPHRLVVMGGGVDETGMLRPSLAAVDPELYRKTAIVAACSSARKAASSIHTPRRPLGDAPGQHLAREPINNGDQIEIAFAHRQYVMSAHQT
ncbi:CRP-like cAMP-binding protein [Pseudorhodobacter sp. 4114]|nr:CRP-like cAMP-binding protein [Pseudorhodobacter sp. 4114]